MLGLIMTSRLYNCTYGRVPVGQVLTLSHITLYDQPLLCLRSGPFTQARRLGGFGGFKRTPYGGPKVQSFPDPTHDIDSHEAG